MYKRTKLLFHRFWTFSVYFLSVSLDWAGRSLDYVVGAYYYYYAHTHTHTQIQDLEEKLAQGEELDSDQLAKVSRKDDVLYELSLSHQP